MTINLVSDEQYCQQMQQRRQNNLLYFKEAYPAIYNALIKLSPTKTTLNINRANETMDLIVNGHPYYSGDAAQFSDEEVDGFSSAFHSGSQILGINPSFQGDYYFPRFFNRLADKLVSRSPLNKDTWKKHPRYTLPHFFPHIVFLGCGLGLHIAKVLEQHSVKRVYIMEPNLEVFFMSMLVIDWKGLLTSRYEKGLPHVRFFLGSDDQVSLQKTMLWNYLITQCPVYPLATLYYNHRSQPHFKKMCEEFDTQLWVYLSCWGNYDDEVNQWNQALHNIQRNIPLLPLANKQLREIPITIVGSGASLDKRADQLRTLTTNSLIISCGSSITALHDLGIKPHLHIELESDYIITVGYLEALNDPDYLADIAFIGPMHLNPYIFDFFKKKAAFFKNDDNGLYHAYSHNRTKDTANINHCAPTCVNLALSFSMLYGAEKIFLFGTDFGFFNLKEHHAKGSVYYQDNVHEQFKEAVDYKKYDLFEIESVHGEPILTQPLYFAAKERIENCIKYHRNPANQNNQTINKVAKIYNCSDGADIEGTEWIRCDAPPVTQNEKEKQKIDQTIASLFDLIHQKEEPKNIINTIRKISTIELNKSTQLLTKPLKLPRQELNELEYFDSLCQNIMIQLQQIKQSHTIAYALLKGSIYHLLHIGYSHLLALQADTDDKQPKQASFLAAWQSTYLEFLNNVPNHFKSIINKDYATEQGDHWLHRNLTEPEER